MFEYLHFSQRNKNIKFTFLFSTFQNSNMVCKQFSQKNKINSKHFSNIHHFWWVRLDCGNWHVIYKETYGQVNITKVFFEKYYSYIASNKMLLVDQPVQSKQVKIGPQELGLGLATLWGQAVGQLISLDKVERFLWPTGLILMCHNERNLFLF